MTENARLFLDIRTRRQGTTLDDIEELEATVNASATELLEVAFTGLVMARGLDSGTSLYVIESIKAALAKGADHVFLAEQLIFQLIDIIAASDCMNYPNISQDIARDIANGLEKGSHRPVNVVRLH